MTQFDDKSFREHAKWLAFQRSSFEWPKYWRAVIFKLDKKYDVLTDKTTYLVLPRNPEYDKYADKESAVTSLILGWEVEQPPPMHLGPAEFDTLEDIDQWAQVAWRMR